MKHESSDVAVYATTDYKKFNRKKGNRELNTQKIRKIVRDIRHGNDMLADFPILTVEADGKLDVVDGQHRLEAAVRTKRPVFYIVRKEDVSLERMARFNSLQDKWKPADFINCYIEQGSNDYKKLEEFIDCYQVPVSVALNLLHYGITGRDGGAKEDLAELFRKGQFVCKHWKQAVDIIEQCKRFGAFESWNSRPFITAIGKILVADVCDFDELVEKFEADPRRLQKHGNSKEYLVDLEQIYNKGYHQRRVIF